MTPTQRKAMEQALEALELVRVSGLRKPATHVESITALRAALAEPDHFADTSKMVAEQPAEQEPAIYPDEAFDMGLEAIPYYTAPQPAKRVPLTDDEITTVAFTQHNYPQGTVGSAMFRKGVRWAEAAHGITGETK